jgi:hypothetical protein
LIAASERGTDRHSPMVALAAFAMKGDRHNAEIIADVRLAER